MMRIYFSGLVIIALTLLSSCKTTPNVVQRINTSNQLALNHNWQADMIAAHSFNLMSYRPKQINSAAILTIYIEGDGFAWRTRSSPSNNPSPINPIGLKLALNHPQGNAAYLARPCQYVSSNTSGCDKAYWTDKRFSEEVVAASNQVIDALKSKFGAAQLQLVGYSGGGAIAALVSARRDDVIHLITVAGNLDHRAWTDKKRLSPLKGSLNPADYWQKLNPIKQTHFVGSKDYIVGHAVAQSYKRRFNNNAKIEIKTLPNFDHHCCWVERWPVLSAPYLTY